jgi:hypothetical protein
VIQSPTYTVDIKYSALEAINASSVPGNRKSDAAAAAYSEGWRIVSPDLRRRTQIANMRKLSQRIIFQQGSENAAVIGYLERSYKEGADTEERYAAVNVLSSLAARGNLEEQAIATLGSFLIALNGKRSDGSVTQADEQMVRVVIPALGNTRKAAAIRPLNTVQSVDWPNVVKRLAREAISKING